MGIMNPRQVSTCNTLPQGIKIEIDFYQREIEKLSESLDCVEAILDETSALVHTTFDDHVQGLDEDLTRI